MEKRLPKIDHLTLEELEELQGMVEEACNGKKQEMIEEAKLQAEQIAESVGMTLSELAGKGRKGATKRPRKPPLYQNPGNPKQTWSGVGQKPDWLEEKLEQGMKLEELKIKR